MKLLIKKISSPVNSSFSVRKDELPCLDENLHFHPEIELIYIVKGTGMRIVGNSMEAFKEGDLVLLGPNIPHLWRNDRSFYNLEEQNVEVIIVQFNKSFLGHDFFHKPETQHLEHMFNNRSQCGISIKGKAFHSISLKVKKLLSADNFNRILLLLEILNEIAITSDYTLLSNSGYNELFTQTDSVRMDKVYKYLIDHFKVDIKLEEIAQVANLSSAAFCRYFKKRTKKCFSVFLNEIKVSHACKLLRETDCSVSEVGFECGFNSITNFNRQFKRILHMPPYEYRKQYNSPL